MRLLIVSNRAPVSIVNEDGNYHYEESSGGLASGLRAYIERVKKEARSEVEIVWIGWPGTAVDDEDKVKKEIFEKFGVHSVFLSTEVMEKFYEGFCNKTLWPLFHYFPAFTVYDKEFWEQYVSVNQTFCDEVLKVLGDSDDEIWVHDYHLMLLPAMIREKRSGASIGFFLHIPFPSYEVFRLLPSNWRKKILEGLYGADLIGFHTHDYCTYFLRSALRILGVDHQMGEGLYKNRLVKVDTFPMGIDYEKYHTAALSEKVAEEKQKLKNTLPAQKLILSMDRQDYSKGILNRLNGYEYFLENNPAWRQRVMMILIVIPSRIGVESYQAIKSQIDEHVGRINGKFGTLEWMPIVYQYHSIPFDEMIALYNVSAVALITPLRDGMNLIAKEYIASRTDGTGVLILSEMAGAVDELAESVIINPNNNEEISDSLLLALEMDEKEQGRRVDIMQQRIHSYDVFKWSEDFLNTLRDVKIKQERLGATVLNRTAREKMVAAFRQASGRMLFLDYDGTLVPHEATPALAAPGKHLLNLLERLTAIKNTRVVIISGRDKHTMAEWFGHLPLELAAEHGLLMKKPGEDWRMLRPVRNDWKKRIVPIISQYVEKLPGSFIEEKEYSLAFHYRKSDPEFASERVKELMDYLVSYASNMDLQMLKGNKVLEVRNAGVDKGIAVMQCLLKITRHPWFILAVGDDQTDEDMFHVIPPGAHSIKVGAHSSEAMFNVNSPWDVLELLNDFCENQ